MYIININKFTHVHTIIFIFNNFLIMHTPQHRKRKRRRKRKRERINKYKKGRSKIKTSIYQLFNII
jgi:hypothetical protein